MREPTLKASIVLQNALSGIRQAIVGDQSGQDLIEYALVVSLIALAATAGMSSLASSLGTALTGMGAKLGTYTS